jgi:Holliday junction resolvase
MRTPEGNEKAALDKFLEEIGAYVIKPVTFGYGKSGAPDRVCCIGGQFWGLEVKREGKDPTPIQNRRMREIIENGGRVAWGTASDIIPVVQRWLTKRAFGGSFDEVQDVHAAPMVPR